RLTERPPRPRSAEKPGDEVLLPGSGGGDEEETPGFPLAPYSPGPGEGGGCGGCDANPEYDEGASPGKRGQRGPPGTGGRRAGSSPRRAGREVRVVLSFQRSPNGGETSRIVDAAGEDHGASVHRKQTLAFVGKALGPSSSDWRALSCLPQVAHSRRIQFRWAELARKKSDGTARDDSLKALLSTRRKNQESHYETPKRAVAASRGDGANGKGARARALEDLSTSPEDGVVLSRVRVRSDLSRVVLSGGGREIRRASIGGVDHSSCRAPKDRGESGVALSPGPSTARRTTAEDDGRPSPRPRGAGRDGMRVRAPLVDGRRRPPGGGRVPPAEVRRGTGRVPPPAPPNPQTEPFLAGPGDESHSLGGRMRRRDGATGPTRSTRLGGGRRGRSILGRRGSTSLSSSKSPPPPPGPKPRRSSDVAIGASCRSDAKRPPPRR
ncbi:hypothetical protein THAOC_07201, partial [Thalassiosira oceanica]